MASERVRQLIAKEKREKDKNREKRRRRIKEKREEMNKKKFRQSYCNQEKEKRSSH